MPKKNPNNNGETFFQQLRRSARFHAHLDNNQSDHRENPNSRKNKLRVSTNLSSKKPNFRRCFVTDSRESIFGRLINANAEENAVSGSRKSQKSMNGEVEINGSEGFEPFVVTNSKKGASQRLTQKLDSDKIKCKSFRSIESKVEENEVSGMRKSARFMNGGVEIDGLEGFEPSDFTDSRKSVCLRSTQLGDSEKVTPRSQRLNTTMVKENVVTGLRKSVRLMNSESQINGFEDFGPSAFTNSRKSVPPRLTQKGKSGKVKGRSQRLNSASVEENALNGLRKSVRLMNSELQVNGFEEFGSSTVTYSRSGSLSLTQKGDLEKVKGGSQRLNRGRVGENVVCELRKSARLMNSEFRINGLEDFWHSTVIDSRKSVSPRLNYKGGSGVKGRSLGMKSRRVEENVATLTKKSAKSTNSEVEINGSEDLGACSLLVSMAKSRKRRENKRREKLIGFNESGSKKGVPSKKSGAECGIVGSSRGISLRKNHGFLFGPLGSQEWSEEQEAALQRAYLIAKPSPRFWKKVSQLVPGKSAQECFDKIHSTFATPPPPCSRTKRKSFSPLGQLNLSGHKLLEPIAPSTKKPKSSKQKGLLAQRTVRHILRKHELVDQENEADLFSVLETMNPRAQVLPQIKLPVTPDCILEPSNCLQKSHERLALAKVENPSEEKLISPEVLKQVKNLALHEKYIDQLHCREAKRRTEFSRMRNSIVGKEGAKEGFLQTAEVVRAARTALVSDVRDVFKQFQQMPNDSPSNYEDFEDDGNGGVDGDDENDM